MAFIKCIIFFLLLPVFCLAQKPAKLEAKFVTRFPFKMYSGGVMIIKACFENVKDSFNFVLDSGSGGISLDSTTCSEYNIDARVTDTTITGIAGVKKVSFVFNKTLHFPGLELENLNFHVGDYEVLTSVCGEKIDGIIGYSFFSRYIVAINFDSMYIDVYNPGRIKYPRGGTVLKPLFTFLPIQGVEIRDRRKINFNFYFDTGAGLCFLITEKLNNDSSILLGKRKPVTTQAEGLGGKLQMRLTVMKEVKLGPYRFKNVPTYLYKDDFNITSYPFTGGLIGNELLRRFNMTVNYPAREIHLIPNGRFNERFEYGYTGFSIYYVSGKIIVEDIIKGSPADKAGFMVDDEILTVGTNFSKNIREYKDLLQEPKVKIPVIIKRNEQLMTIMLHTGSIL